MSEKPLGLEDPVTREDIERFQLIEEGQARIGLELLRVEKRRVFLLASSKRLDDDHNKLFGQLLIERGLSPDIPVELDAKTGLLKLVGERPVPIQKAPVGDAPEAGLEEDEEDDDEAEG